MQSASEHCPRACAPSARTILNLLTLPICYESQVFVQSSALHTVGTSLYEQLGMLLLLKMLTAGIVLCQPGTPEAKDDKREGVWRKRHREASPEPRQSPTASPSPARNKQQLFPFSVSSWSSQP